MAESERARPDPSRRITIRCRKTGELVPVVPGVRFHEPNRVEKRDRTCHRVVEHGSILALASLCDTLPLCTHRAER